MDQTNNQFQLIKTIQAKSDQCVRCGLCIPHCPTYHVTEIECESPRGRIALFDAYAENKLPATSKMLTYLDHCLSCRACEAVCPSEVKYGEILAAGKALLTIKNDASKLPFSVKLTIWIANSTRYPFLFKYLTYLLRFYQISGLQSFLRKTKLLKLLKLDRLNHYLETPVTPYSFKDFYEATDPIGSVGLFTGCITRLIDYDVLLASIKILNHYGYHVHIPKQQVCCGALQKHAGLLADSQSLFKQNHLAFSNMETVISVASGCGATLQDDYQSKTSPTVMDPLAFIAKQQKQLTLKPLPKKIAVHIPCTLKNVLQQDTGVIKLLKEIPGCEISVLKTRYCCGAAGSNMLQHEKMALTLADELIDEILKLTPDIVVTSNIGCQLHLSQRLKALGKSIEITHPSMLLAACL